VRVKRYLLVHRHRPQSSSHCSPPGFPLQQEYGRSFPHSAFRDAFTALPMDVHKVDGAALARAGARDSTQWIVIAGWSCQDLSPGCNGSGLTGRHSLDFFNVVRIIGALQALQPARPPL
jgi:site-specific DNA-cytosine methylase